MPYLGTVELKESDIRRIDITSSTSATHTLTWTAPNEQSLIVTINGVKQQNNYTVSGTTLTLDTALSASDLLEVIGINDIGTTITPAQGSVDTDQLANDAVTSAKIAAGTIATADIADDAVDADKLANSINTEIAANTAKVTNATHTGDVTGATVLTIADDAVDIAMLSATGTADSTTFLRGDNAWATLADVSGLASVQTFTSSGTWTRPSGITKVIMQIQGAGGAGSRHDSDDAKRHGGAGGGYTTKLLDVSSISTSTITVGAGGTATTANNTAGGNGGSSQWADGTNTIYGNGGGGGTTTSNTPTAGATGVGGDVNIQGQASFSSNQSTGQAGSKAGSSMLGFAGDAHWSGSNPGSLGATGYGAGTGAGVSNNSLTAGGGIVIVWEYK